MIARPHTESYQTEDESSGRPADYYFAEKVTDPCGASREVLESVAKEEVIIMVEIVREIVEQARRELVSFNPFES